MEQPVHGDRGSRGIRTAGPRDRPARRPRDRTRPRCRARDPGRVSPAPRGRQPRSGTSTVPGPAACLRSQVRHPRGAIPTTWRSTASRCR